MAKMKRLFPARAVILFSIGSFVAGASLIAGSGLVGEASADMPSVSAPATGPVITTPIASQAIGDEQIREFIMNNPDVIIASLQAYDQRRAQDAQNSSDEIIRQNLPAIFSPDLPYIGNPDGNVSVAIFSDYRCPHCQRAASETALLLESDPNVRVVIHEYPVLGEQSIAAARYALAIRRILGPQAYADLHERLFVQAGADPQWMMADALAIGLVWDDVRSVMFGPEVNAEVEAAKDLATVLQVRGTPFIVIGDRGFPGAMSADQMRSVIAETRN